MGGQLESKKIKEWPRSAYQKASKKNERRSKEKPQSGEIQLMSVYWEEGVQPPHKAHT